MGWGCRSGICLADGWLTGWLSARSRRADSCPDGQRDDDQRQPTKAQDAAEGQPAQCRDAQRPTEYRAGSEPSPAVSGTGMKRYKNIGLDYGVNEVFMEETHK